MPAKKKAAEEAVATPVVSDEELLKQKKEEAKAKKDAEKTEKKATRATKHVTHTVTEQKAAQKRNLLKQHGKKYRAAAAKIEKNKMYPFTAAVALVRETATTKFDASVEVHVRLGVDTKKSEQAVRSTVVLPHGTGKTLRVVAFVPDDQAAAAKKAGATEAGEDDLIEKIAKGWLDFDVAVATPAMMKKIGKIARVLGQQGLMPNPKTGTVTDNISAAIEEIKKGKVEFRIDKAGILHNVVGKASFAADKLAENLKTYLTAVNDVKPKGVKGVYFLSIYLTTSMGPSVKLDLADATKGL